MHEFSLAQNMAEIIRENADGRKVISVDINVGAFSGAVPEALLFSAETIFKDILGDAIDIRFHIEPARAVCICGTGYVMESPTSFCPSCNGFSHTLTSGTGVFVKSIEVEDKG